MVNCIYIFFHTIFLLDLSSKIGYFQSIGMLPTLTLRQLNTAGQTQQGLVDDVSTRSLLTVRVGEGAGKLSTGIANALVGYEAGKNHQQGSYVTFVGYQAGEQNTNASYGTFVGAYAGRQNLRGNENVFVGYRTGERNISGSDCVAVGAYAMRDNASGNFSVAVGYSAGERCLDGSFNTMVGAEAGQDNRSGNFNTMAGFRSGRSAFQGNYNTYFGAYAGYSNNRGNENCFIGYRSGEALEQGNLNIAIGAYSMAKATLGHSNISIGPYSAMFNRGSGNILVGWNAGSSNYTGGLNVIVGVEAGTSNQGSRNVLIGYQSATYWKGDCNVLIGSEVSQTGSGYNSVIIGYKSGGFNYKDGNRNIFIGAGSDAIQSNVSDAISIGTYNVTTTTESLSIGKNIQNAGINSVSLGFSIETNAENSVLVGKDLIITSAIYFKDPLNLSLTTVVLQDATEKFGIQQIRYTNYVLGTSNAPHETAEFGYNSSNVFNTTTIPKQNRISPNTYDLANYMFYYATIYGSNLFYTHPTFNIQLFTQDLAQANIKTYFYGSNIHSSQFLTITGNTLLTNNNTSLNESFYTGLHFTPFENYSLITNITTFNSNDFIYPIHVVKKHSEPILQFNTSNEQLIYTDLTTPAKTIPLNQIPTSFIYETNGIQIDSNCHYIIDTPPQYGSLNKVIGSNLEEFNYTSFIQGLFVEEDSFTILPSTYIYDDASNLYGVHSNIRYTVHLPYKNEYLLTANTIQALPNVPIFMDSNMLIWTTNGTFESNLSKTIQLDGFDERFTLRHLGQTYTCNQALNVNLFNPHTIACNITVQSNAFVLENIPEYRVNCNLTLYVGNTYQFAQYNVSNIGYPLRFSATIDGPEYSSNVNRFGTIGTNGYVQIQITESTPNPLYYYASEQSNMGGFIPIQPIPKTHLSIPYGQFIQGTSYLISPIATVLLTNEPIEPIKLSITLPQWSCNLSIPIYTSEEILWEDTNDTLYTSLLIDKPITNQYGPLKTASNIYIETYPSNGALKWIGNSNNLQNIYYQPLNPWDVSEDTVTFLLQRPTNIQEVKRFTWNLLNVPTQIASSNYWIDAPTSNILTLVSTVPKSNSFIHNSNVSLSNVLQWNIVQYNLNQTIQSSTSKKIIEPNVSYIQSYGLSNTMSNLIIQSNLDIRPNTYFNQVIHIYETFTLFITHDKTSNITTSSNISLIQSSDDLYTPHSNIVITFKDSNVIQQIKSYQSNFEVFHEWKTFSNIYDTIDKDLIYQSQSNYPYGLSNFINTFETPNLSTYQTFSYSNYDKHAYISVYDNFVPLNRTTLYASNAIFYSIPQQSPSYPTAYISVLKNVGPVTEYHSSNIHLGRIYLKSPQSSSIGTVVPYTYTYAYSNVSINSTSQIQTLVIPKYSRTPFVSQTISTYSSRVNQQWIQIDDTYTGSIINWELYIRSQSQLNFAPTHVYVTSVQKGFLSSNQSIVHRISLSDISLDLIRYQATGRYEYDTVTYFYGRETTGQCSALYKNTVFIKHSLKSSVYTISSRLSKWNAVTSNIFYVTLPDEPSNSLRIQFPTLDQLTTGVQLYQYPNHAIAGNILIWSQLTSNYTYFKTKPSYVLDTETIAINLPYRILSTNGTTLEDNASGIQIQVIDFTDYPQPNKTTYGTIKSIDIFNENHQILLSGYIKSIVENYVDKGGSLNPSLLEFVVSRPLNYGFILHIDQKTNLIERFTYNDVLLNKIYYISYQPNHIQNDVLYFKWLFQNRISPEYNIVFKNYFIKNISFPIVPYRKNSSYRTLNWTQKAIVSEGARNDIVSNVLMVQPSVVYYEYHSNTTIASNSSIQIYNDSFNLTRNISLVPVAYSEPISIKQPSITLTLDQSDRISLASIVSSNVLSYSMDKVYQLYAYLDIPPTQGIFTYETVGVGSNLSKWSYQDLIENKVFYHHLGSLTSDNDVFTVRFATHSYDVTETVLQVNIQILPLPKVISNRYDVIYELQSNIALNTIYPFDKSLQLNTSSNTFLKLISTSNMRGMVNNNESMIIPVTEFKNTSSGYKLTANYFEKPVELFYEDISMKFTISSIATTNHPHSLAYVPYYEPYFSYSWVSQLNRFESSNQIKTPLIPDNGLQVIEYLFSSNESLIFKDVETTFAIDIQPYNELYTNTLYLNDKGKQLSSNLQTYDFTFEFTNNQNTLIGSFHFTESLIEIYVPTIPQPYQLRGFEAFPFNTYSLLQIVFKDTANEGGVSIYINPDETKSNRDNQHLNLLANTSLILDITTLSRVALKSYASDANNYIGFSNHKVQQNYAQLSSYQNLTHFTNRLYIRNFELFTKNINIDTANIEEATYNVVLGKAIQVKGKKNICVGTNFTTLGRNSIILGNDIGYSANSISQIYESIIIGNTSFQGSTIRGIIAIGNELMNNLIGIDEESSDAINKFIANRPVIIGNNIGPEKVDYHINIANTLLRTKIGGLRDQIYLGNEQEFVAIGYTSNVYLQGPEILFVNGGIRANKVLTDILECTGGTLNIDAVSSSNLISSNVFAGLVVTDRLVCRSGTLAIDAISTSNIRAGYILTDVLECAGGILSIDAVDSSNVSTSNLYAQKIVTDQLEYRSGVVNLQLINSSNIYASNIIVDKITTNAIEYSKGDIEFFGLIASNVATNNFTTSNMIVNHSFYINPNAVGNVVTEGLRATLFDRVSKVFLITSETSILSWVSEGVHYVDESDVEIFVNGIKLTYYNNNKYHYKITDTHYLNDFTQTQFDIQLTDPVYPNDVVDIHISPKIVSLSGNVYDYFAITSNVLNLKTVNEFYSPNATFSNIRILGSTIVGNYSQKHPYQVESVHKVFLNQTRTNTLNVMTNGYFEASPNDVHLYINGTKLAYLDSNSFDYRLTSNFSLQNQQTTFTLTLDTDVIAGDVIDITLFPKAPRDQFGYFYQNFEIKTSWNDDTASLTTLSNVGIGTHLPLSLFHVNGNAKIDGIVSTQFIDGQLYGPWKLQSNIASPLLTIQQLNTNSQYTIAEFSTATNKILTIGQKGVGIGTTYSHADLHVQSNILIGQHPLLQSYASPLTIVHSNACFTNWSIHELRSSIYEWKIGNLAIPSIHWTAEVTPQSEFILQNKTNNIKPIYITHQGILYTSNVSILNSLTSSNIFGEIITTSNIKINTSGAIHQPAILVTRDIESSIPLLQVSVQSNVFVVNSKGWIGIGTNAPTVALDIDSSSAIQLPKGTSFTRPSQRSGLIRYNTLTAEFEGCYGSSWGTLGGVKSFDGSTRIETSNNELTFYTNQQKYITLTSNGALGIGTTLPYSSLHVQGNTYISGDLRVNGGLVFSNIQVLSDDVFINQDRPAFRNRLQIQPYVHKFIVPSNDYILHTEIIEGLWLILPENVDIYINGTKWIYIDEVNCDFTLSYTHINSNTYIQLHYLTPLHTGDIVDLTIWPKYLTNTSLLQPGYVLQNIYTYWNRDASSNIYYTKGNIGIGTTLASCLLDIYGNTRVQNLEATNTQTSNATVYNTWNLGTHLIDKNTYSIQRPVTHQAPYINIGQTGGPSLFYIDGNGNIGIGTSLPKQKFHITNASILIEDTTPTIQLNQWSLQTNGFNRFDISNNSVSKITLLPNGNIGIGTFNPIETLHIQGGIHVVKNIKSESIDCSNININNSLVVQSNTVIKGNTQINNTTLNTALTVYQSNTNGAVASFYGSNGLVCLFMDSNGYIGIGTEKPSASLHIQSKDGIIIPKGTTNERPLQPIQGQIRYNTVLQQFEGYGANSLWGSLGGVKSSDQKTYISAELYPGFNDCNLRFYTNDILQTTINSNGNVGIGTTLIHRKLCVEGDAYISGTIIAPFMNITNTLFYNEDSPALRNRLQLTPTQLIKIIDQDNVREFQITIGGVWMIHSQKVHIYINGYKLVYLDTLNKDYTINFSHINENTVVTITLDNALYIGDVLDISIWPSYYNEDILNQSGIVIQNFNYSIWSSNMTNANITYTTGNVGIGTTIPTQKLSVQGNALIRGELSLYRAKYHTGGIFGTEEDPINGGSVTYNLNIYDNAIFELSTYTITLNIQFLNIAQNVGKTITIIFNERSYSNRILIIDDLVRFANERPTNILARSISQLTITVIKPTLLLGKFEANVGAF
jgi:hypothetical protein